MNPPEIPKTLGGPEPLETYLTGGGDVDLEAETVLMLDDDPRSDYEIAVVLSTVGYTDDVARRRHSGGLFDLSPRVRQRLGMYREPELYLERRAETWTRRVERQLVYLGRGLSYVELWAVAFVLLITNQVTFWDVRGGYAIDITAISIALIVASISISGFVQVFSRRYLFYRLQGNYAMARWVTVRTLGVGVVVSSAAVIAAWAVMEHGLHALTPDATTIFLQFGLLFVLLFASMAPLYALQAFGPMLLALCAGGAVLVFARLADPLGYTYLILDERLAYHLQTQALLVVVVLASFYSWLEQRRRRDGEPLEHPELVPRPAGLFLGTAAYFLYGGGFFALLFLSRIVGGFETRHPFLPETTEMYLLDIGMLVLLPGIVVGAACIQNLSHDTGRKLRGLEVVQLRTFNQDLRNTYRRMALTVVATSTVTGAGILLVVNSHSGPDLFYLVLSIIVHVLM